MIINCKKANFNNVVHNFFKKVTQDDTVRTALYSRLAICHHCTICLILLYTVKHIMQKKLLKNCKG